MLQIRKINDIFLLLDLLQEPSVADGQRNQCGKRLLRPLHLVHRKRRILFNMIMKRIQPFLQLLAKLLYVALPLFVNSLLLCAPDHRELCQRIRGNLQKLLPKTLPVRFALCFLCESIQRSEKLTFLLFQKLQIRKRSIRKSGNADHRLVQHGQLRQICCFLPENLSIPGALKQLLLVFHMVIFPSLLQPHLRIRM